MEKKQSSGLEKYRYLYYVVEKYYQELCLQAMRLKEAIREEYQKQELNPCMRQFQVLGKKMSLRKYCLLSNRVQFKLPPEKYGPIKMMTDADFERALQIIEELEYFLINALGRDILPKKYQALLELELLWKKGELETELEKLKKNAKERKHEKGV